MDVPFHQTPFYVPQFNIPGLTIGGASNYPNDTWQNTYSGRVDINGHKGAHDLEIGGEFLRVRDTKEWSLNRRGTYVFNTRPSDAELERRFPADAWDDPSRWDVSGLEPYLNRFDINFHPDYLIDIPRPTMAFWIGDNWRATNNLSINLGVRYDADWGATDPPGVDGDRDAPHRQRPRVGRLRLQDRHPRPEQHRAAHRLRLQPRRRRRPGDPRRQRLLLQHAGLERHLQPSVLQPGDRGDADAGRTRLHREPDARRDG